MKKVAILLAVILLVSCAEMQQFASDTARQSSTKSFSLTEADVIAGLKQALTIATDTAVKNLGVKNGYYGNALVKISLPPQAQTIIKNISKIPGGQKLVNDVEIGINRSAEDAAKEVAPIFISAITQMSIADAWGVLRGADTAATHYLRKATYQQLLTLYKPKIKNSVDKPLVAGVSTSKTWNTLTNNWNTLATSSLGTLSDLKPVNTNLEDYLTRKALDGLFLKVAEQEKMIRKNPADQVTALLRRVFGKK